MPKRGAEPALRADARRNRARVIAAAERAFAADGVGVTTEEIARRAGVGVGTVFRHFATKEALIAAVLGEQLGRAAALIESHAADADPGAAFFTVLDRLIADGAHKRDLIDALEGRGMNVRSAVGDASSRVRKAFTALLKRAQADGAVRASVTAVDLMALLAAVSSATRAGASPQRLLAIVSAGLRR